MRPLDQSVEPNSASEWDMTDKHRVLWLVPIKLLQEVAHASTKEQGKGNGTKGSNHGKGSDQMGMDDDARASDLWRAGQYASHITCLTLDWAGNKFFYHECLRRATTPDLPSIGA